MLKKLLTFKEVLEVTGLSQAHVYRMLKDGRFPAAVKTLNPSKNTGAKLINTWHRKDVTPFIKDRNKIRSLDRSTLEKKVGDKDYALAYLEGRYPFDWIDNPDLPYNYDNSRIDPTVPDAEHIEDFSMYLEPRLTRLEKESRNHQWVTVGVAALISITLFYVLWG